MKKTKEDDHLIEKVTKIAVQTALEFLEKEKQREHKENKDYRLRNIKLLLRNYRNFVLHSEEIKEDLTSLQKVKLMDELYVEKFAVESIMKSKQRTLVMVQFMKKMVETYRVMCEKSGNPDEERRYKIIHSMYLSEEKKTADEIAECHFVDRRTVFRDIQKASEALSVLMFGVDGIRIE